jgi:addiction module HigA family antidote
MESNMDCKMTRRPTAPGVILAEFYLAPKGVTVKDFANAAGISRKHMSDIIHGHAAVTADVASRVAEALGTTAQYWLNLQNAVDLYDASKRVQKAKRKPYRIAAFEAAYPMAAAPRD